MLPAVAAQHLIFRGAVDLGEGPVEGVDLWISGSAAVAFQGPTQLGVLTGLTIGLTSDRRIRLAGSTDGEPAAWEGAEPERIISRWGGATVAWPDGTRWTRAEVTQSQYGVRVTAPGQTPRELVGSKAEAVGSQRWIVGPDGTRISASAQKGGCGCGGGGA